MDFFLYICEIVESLLNENKVCLFPWDQFMKYFSFNICPIVFVKRKNGHIHIKRVQSLVAYSIDAAVTWLEYCLRQTPDNQSYSFVSLTFLFYRDPSYFFTDGGGSKEKFVVPCPVWRVSQAKSQRLPNGARAAWHSSCIYLRAGKYKFSSDILWRHFFSVNYRL